MFKKDQEFYSVSLQESASQESTSNTMSLVPLEPSLLAGILLLGCHQETCIKDIRT